MAQAEADANEARDERDDAIRAFEELKLKYKEDTSKIRNAVSQSQVMYLYSMLMVSAPQLQTARTNAATKDQQQVEFIAQLKREARNWQGHFLRVEQQRFALSSRLEEIDPEYLVRTQPDTFVFTNSISR